MLCSKNPVNFNFLVFLLNSKKDMSRKGPYILFLKHRNQGNVYKVDNFLVEVISKAII